MARMKTGALSLCLMIGFTLCFPATTRADVVSGQVYGADGMVVTNQTFRVLKDGTTVVTTFRTDESGNFSVLLEPGAYRVRREGNDDAEGDIRGYPQPVRQDVRLRRR